MKQFAAMMMFAAWLLYGAMPAVAMPSIPHEMPGQTAMSGSGMAMHDHAQHAGGTAKTACSQGDGHGQQPCPHGSKICVAPFCSACLVVLPDVDFADIGRFIHRYPAPETGPSFVVSGPAPLTPPPRA
ncbi:hypothetical protein JNB91_28875 [Rhizobium wenxiniae]|uniref:hypothetical protein n=1 Tax=Rhizobium wenxiniae TaxID=1737357 RepID=UPI001C6ECC2C|nr:hypothetical protein [Rhizobium wenxiniae]MBW9091799.1 hypothetical protein [Rhizobium wenxiniae]